MNIFLEDATCKSNLYPFTATRSVADIRIGILTIREKWERLLDKKVNTIAEISRGHPAISEEQQVAANIIPSENWYKGFINKKNPVDTILNYPWHVFQLNEKALRDDFQLITRHRETQPLSLTNKTVSPENIFIEEGAVVEHCIINASGGPVYIGKNALVMEGCLIRGPVALCEGSTVKMGTKVYGATTIGPYCIAGGEIKNSVMFGYSNKAHDGYLGDSVIGEWCNLGAGTSNSNLKNTAGIVNVWLHSKKSFVPVGVKCGLLMGDYSRSAINTSFNTGTTAGVCCNIFGQGFPGRYIPDFSWGAEEYVLEKALVDIDNWKKMKGRAITAEEIKILSDIYASQKIKHA